MNASGEASSQLYTLGAVRIGSLWDTTAASETSAQAAELARTLVGEHG